MARAVIQYRVCDRCPKEQPATTTDKFSLNGYKYQVDLCEEHSAALYGQVMAWADIGVCTGEPTYLEKVQPRAGAVVVSAPRVRPEAPAEPKREELPVAAERWNLTDHAREQMERREFTLYDVLMAAERPEVVLPGGADADKRGKEQRTRGRCLVAVDPVEHVIVTVMVNGENRKIDRQKRGAVSGVA